VCPVALPTSATEGPPAGRGERVAVTTLLCGPNHALTPSGYGSGVDKRVLVAGDGEQIRRSVERALRFEEHAVSSAGDGDEALRSISNDRPDVVVLDIMMPRLDGIGVCRLMRTRGDRMPVVVLTARHELSDRVAGLDAGADATW